MKKAFYKFRNPEIGQKFFEFIKILVSAIAGYAVGFFAVEMKYFFISMGVLVLFCLLISILFAQDKTHFDLIDTLKEEQKKGNWVEVVRLGYPLSRPLWLSGRPKTRIEIGEIIKTAVCSVDGEIKIQDETYASTYILASVLIDDLGWTRFSIGQTEKAIASILEGIDAAEKNSHWDIAIKGCRHLCGISLETGDESLFWEMRHRIENMLPYVTKAKKVQEIEASLDFSLSKLKRKQGAFAEALELAESAKTKYEAINDYERLIKVAHLIGAIQEDMKNYVGAEITYLKGMEKARSWQRKERMLSLIESYFDLKIVMLQIDTGYLLSDYFEDKERFTILYDEAKDIADSTNQIKEYRIIGKKYRLLVKTAKRSTSCFAHRSRKKKKEKGTLFPTYSHRNNAKDSRM